MTDQDNEKEGDAEKITLMTIHSAKGLEFKNVFVVGMEENLFPSACHSIRIRSWKRSAACLCGDYTCRRALLFVFCQESV